MIEKKIIRVGKPTKLSEPNLNGILYEPISLKNAINTFLKNEDHIPNVVVLDSSYDSFKDNEYYTIDLNKTLGYCIDIADDYIEILIDDYYSFISKFKNPIAMLRLVGERGNNVGEFNVKKIIAIDIREK